MRVSAKIDYACKALLELAMHWPNSTPVQITTIAKRQNIPLNFLTQILLNLKQLGYVQSTRGKSGGYRLSITPSNIKLSDLIKSMGSIGYSTSNDRKKENTKHIMNVIWNELDELVFKAMDKINFESLGNRKILHDKAFVYEI